jgi:hypothetical protein
MQGARPSDMNVASSTASTEIFRPHANGVSYLGFIRTLSRALRARGYLEIGTHKGDSLSVVDCPSIAVDPKFAFEKDMVGQKEFCLLFQMTSDDFFARYDVRNFFPARVDVAFLDGLHRFEFLLRDFMNTEKACRRNSVILMHDCLPPSPGMATRANRRDQAFPDATIRVVEEHEGFWPGDLWKIIPILQHLRPELNVHCLDCPPTGLVLITGLNPDNTLLDQQYFEIVRRFGEAEHTPGWFDSLYDSIELISSREFLLSENLTKYLWL